MKAIVNLNGSGIQSLVKAQYQALKALDAAIDTFRETAPHPRDYQCNKNPELDYQEDRSGYQEAVDRLREVRDSVEKDIEFLMDQRPGVRIEF